MNTYLSALSDWQVRPHLSQSIDLISIIFTGKVWETLSARTDPEGATENVPSLPR